LNPGPSGPVGSTLTTQPQSLHDLGIIISEEHACGLHVSKNYDEVSIKGT